jgi:hypothetical protein
MPTPAPRLPGVLAAAPLASQSDRMVGVIPCVPGRVGMVGICRRRRVSAVSWDVCWQMPLIIVLIVVGVALSETRRFRR